MCFIFWCVQALDIVKQSKVASIIGEGDRRKASGGKDKTSRRGSRESLEMAYDGEEVSREFLKIASYLLLHWKDGQIVNLSLSD